MTTLRLIGPGRAGGSLAAALADVGCDVRGMLARGDELAGAARGVDVVVIATPDAAVEQVAAAIAPSPDAVVMHLSGSLGLDVLSPHPRRASLHPLVPLPDAEVGRIRLRSGVTFAVSGDPMATKLAHLLGGWPVEVDDEHRAAYHAAACIASNHLVATLGQAERVAASAGVPFEAILSLAHAALEDVSEMGPARALTGPAARGDEATLARHRAALAPEELAGYDAGVALARRLAAAAAAAAAGGATAAATSGATAGVANSATANAHSATERAARCA